MLEGVRWLQRTGWIGLQSVLLLREREDEDRGGCWWIRGKTILRRCLSGFLRVVLGFKSSKEED